MEKIIIVENIRTNTYSLNTSGLVKVNTDKLVYCTATSSEDAMNIINNHLYEYQKKYEKTNPYTKFHVSQETVIKEVSAHFSAMEIPRYKLMDEACNIYVTVDLLNFTEMLDRCMPLSEAVVTVSANGHHIHNRQFNSVKEGQDFIELEIQRICQMPSAKSVSMTEYNNITVVHLNNKPYMEYQLIPLELKNVPEKEDDTIWYTETWNNEDLGCALDNVGIPVTDANVAALRSMCLHLFDDKSGRNEMILETASKLKEILAKKKYKIIFSTGSIFNEASFDKNAQETYEFETPEEIKEFCDPKFTFKLYNQSVPEGSEPVLFARGIVNYDYIRSMIAAYEEATKGERA